MTTPTNFVDRENQQWVVLLGEPYIDGKSGQEILDLSLKLLEQGQMPMPQ